MVEKYIYAPTTHGNCVIIKVEMTPKLDSSGKVDFYNVNTRRFRIVASMKGFYKPDECFDTETEVLKYAKEQIKIHRQKIISRLERDIKYIQNKIEKLVDNPPKIRRWNDI